MGLLDRPQQPQRYGLLSPDVMSLIQSVGSRPAPAPAAPAAPRRERVSGWRVFDRVLGGQTVTQGLDAERARLEAEAMRPQMRARQAQLRQAAGAMGPAAMIAFETNPEKFGESLAEQYAPQVIGAGGIQSVIGNGQRVGAPQSREFGDRIAITDPLTGATSYTDPRPMTPGERTADMVAQTGRINALNVPVAANTDLVDPTTGRQIYQGYRAPDIQNVAPGGEALVFDEAGNVTNRVASSQARPMSDADQAAVARAENTLSQNRVARGRASQFRQQLAAGELNLGPMTNGISGLRNMTGRSDANSLNYDALMNWAKEARDAILAANTGVQTDGDAVRALERIISTPNDERVVSAALQRFEESQAATAQVFERDIQRRSAAPAPASPAPAPAAASGQPVRIYNDDDYARLPSGTMYQAPDGSVRRKS